MIDIIIAGVEIGMQVFFKLIEGKSKKVRAEVTVNDILVSHNAIALNLSVINRSERAFSILKLFLEQGGKIYDGLEIEQVEGKNTLHQIIKYEMRTRTFKFQFANPDPEVHKPMKSFDTNAAIEPDMAETGWLIFSVAGGSGMFSTLGMKVSTSSEVLYIER